MIQKYLNAIIHLFFPELCMGCNQSLMDQEEIICTSCLFHLPLTKFHLDANNEAVQLFRGKIPCAFACSMLYLKSDSISESLIYNLKYNNHPQVGLFLGRRYGVDLLSSPVFKYIDIIVPIPLHKKRRQKRGYNQSEYFAKGLSESLLKPVNFSLLKRNKYQISQTKMASSDRYQNVKGAFSCISPEKAKGKCILLVDDVLTTGATLSSAAEELLQTIPDCKIYIATLAIA